jgi:electron transfer flavoprotein alpha subunit
MGEADPVREGVVEQIEPSFKSRDLDLEVLEREIRLPGVDLKNASVIVTGGMGVGSKEGFDLIFELARVLGGEVAGTRAAVDAGFVSAERQVGQTRVHCLRRLWGGAAPSRDGPVWDDHCHQHRSECSHL